MWTSNKRTVQVPSRFLRALGIEMPACRSELASDVLILAINWLNSDTRIDKDILAEANKDKGRTQFFLNISRILCGQLCLKHEKSTF